MVKKHSSDVVELRFKGAKKLKQLIEICCRYETGVCINGEVQKGFRAKVWQASGSGCDWAWTIYDLYKAGFRLPEHYKRMAQEIEREGGI